jgi:hypothetical protein
MEYHKCRKCEKTYEELDSDKHSNDGGRYVKAYLGFCGLKCYHKLTKTQKAHEKMILAVHGTIRKDNHYVIE